MVCPRTFRKDFVELKLGLYRPHGLLALVADGELLAALGTTTCENLTAALCRHPGTEAVALSALPLVGLIRTLHLESSWDNTNVQF